MNSSNGISISWSRRFQILCIVYMVICTLFLSWVNRFVILFIETYGWHTFNMIVMGMGTVSILVIAGLVVRKIVLFPPHILEITTIGLGVLLSLWIASAVCC